MCGSVAGSKSPSTGAASILPRQPQSVALSGQRAATASSMRRTRPTINFEFLAQEGMVAPGDLELFSYASDAEGAWQELTRLGLVSGPRPPGLPSLGDP